MLQVAKRLLEKEMLNKADMVELLGPRPFQESSSYEELQEDFGELEDDMPVCLRNWTKSKEDVQRL